MNRLRESWARMGETGRWRVLILGALLVGALIPSSLSLAITRDWPGLLLNLGSEMGGAFITFILLDLIIASRDQKEARERKLGDLKARLTHKLGSSLNTEARRAAEELRMLGWLTDGTLEGVELIGANLEGVDLRRAVLRGARLYRANLQGARLYEADLRGAFLTGADLSGATMGRVRLDGAYLAGANLKDCARLPRGALARANRLKGATLPDGSRYDGCYQLPGDLRELRKQLRRAGAAADDEAAIAAWYGVPLEAYRRGQRRRAAPDDGSGGA